MPDLGDLRLDRTPDPDPTLGRRRWPLLLLIPLLALVGYLVWNLMQSRRDRDAVRVQTEQQAAPADAARPAAVEGEDLELPPLGESDPLVRQLVGALSAHPRIAAWLATDQLVRNFTSILVAIGDGRSPSRQLSRLQPPGEFVAIEDGSRAQINPASYRRYDEYADAIAGLDPQSTAKLYATLKPRLQEAYVELGHPAEDVDRAMERAFRQLLETPIPEREVGLVPKGGLWEFEDPKLRGLTPAQRQFLRMGPRNMRLVKAKLRELAPLMGLDVPSEER